MHPDPVRVAVVFAVVGLMLPVPRVVLALL
jgi:hypothetical protein